MHFYPQGIAQLAQTAIVMGFGLLSVATFARRAYPRSGWLGRMAWLVLTFALLGAADLWLNTGVGGPYDYHGVGTSLHYWVLLIAILVTLGTFIATLRAHRKTRLPSPQTVTSAEAAS